MFEGIEESKQGVVLSLNVSPGNGEFAVVGFSGNSLKLRTKSKAQKGLANREIEKELGRVLSSNVKILSGFKSRHKTAFVEGLTNEKALQLLESL